MWMLMAPVLILGGVSGVLGIFFALKERAEKRAAREKARATARRSSHASCA